MKRASLFASSVLAAAAFTGCAGEDAQPTVTSEPAAQPCDMLCIPDSATITFGGEVFARAARVEDVPFNQVARGESCRETVTGVLVDEGRPSEQFIESVPVTVRDASNNPANDQTIDKCKVVYRTARPGGGS